MAHIKLSYFDFSGSRGEECRLALHLAGLEFQDVRIKGADWRSVKESTPFGSLPVLEIEGKGTLAQSTAILVYIGREHGLHPTDNWEAAQHEQLMGAAEDFRRDVYDVLQVKDPDRQKAREELASGPAQTWARNVEQHLGTGPFVAGTKLCVADLKLYMVVRWFVSGSIDHVSKDVFADYPKLMALYQAVHTHPSITSWYAK